MPALTWSRAAPPAAPTSILTHDHALDFLIADAALRARDFAYVGMVGSATKRAQVRALASPQRGGDAARPASALSCPIGGRRACATSGPR